MARPIRGQVLGTARARVRGGGAGAGGGPAAADVLGDPAQPVVHDRRVLPADGGQRDPARGGARVRRRGRAAAGALVGHDDRRRAWTTSTPVRTWRSCRAPCSCWRCSASTCSATACATPSTRGPRCGRSSDGPLRGQAAAGDGARAVRDLGGHLRDLQRDPRRRPRDPAGRQAAPARAARADPPAVGLRQAGLRAVREDDGADLHRQRGVLRDADQGGRRDQARRAAHLLARDRRGDHVDGLRDRPGALHRDQGGQDRGPRADGDRARWASRCPSSGSARS